MTVPATGTASKASACAGPGIRALTAPRALARTIATPTRNRASAKTSCARAPLDGRGPTAAWNTAPRNAAARGFASTDGASARQAGAAETARRPRAQTSAPIAVRAQKMAPVRVTRGSAERTAPISSARTIALGMVFASRANASVPRVSRATTARLETARPRK
jgi:hypothetical protein